MPIASIADKLVEPNGFRLHVEPVTGVKSKKDGTC
jgi:hypothetical protein